MLGNELQKAVQKQRRLPDSIRMVPRAIVIAAGLRPHINLLFDSYLRDRGWFGSYDSLPTDANGDPIPWTSYAVTEFLEARLTDSLTVFEYGSGGSTKWYAERVGEIVSVEHDREWYESISSTMPKNAEVVHANLEDGYVETIDDRGPFDIVVIDGRDREAAAKRAVENLSDQGVIIFDDTDRERYQPAFNHLKNKGFREVFWTGMGPGSTQKHRTSIYYRDGNCLGL